MRLIFTNTDSETLEISEQSEYLLQSVEGLGNVTSNLYTTQSYRQDGYGYQGNTLEQRDISIEITITANSKVDMQAKKQKLLNVLNPKLDLFELIYRNGSVETKINGVLENIHFAYEENFGDSVQRVQLDIYCPNPYWSSLYSLSNEVVAYIGGLEFPVRLPSEFATTGESTINVINQGNVETPVKLEISGPSTKPKIINKSTGKFIKVNTKIEAGETLIIITEFGNKRAELDGNFASNLIDYTSTYFDLQKGDNVIEVETEDIADDSKIKITYYNRYLGV